MSREEPICRYFSNGACNRGNECRYSHDRRTRDDNICQFHQQGKCSYGDHCRFYHVPKPAKPPSNVQRHPRPNWNLTASQPSPSTAAPKPTFNVKAPEFIPMAKMVEGSSGLPMSSRPLCPYFESKGKCAGVETECQLVHGELCDMCNTYCLHPFNETAKSQHLKDCAKKHEEAMEFAFIESKSREKSCGVCMESIYEKNLRFGILNGCKHCFCLECIRQWRSNHSNPDLDSKVVRSCPECRQHSDYVIPSVVWVEDEVEKKLLIEMYKENTKTKVCKYYNGQRTRGDCPFGNKCFYKHQLPDGSIDPGESPHARRRPRLSDWFLDSDDDDDDYLDEETAIRMILSAGFGRSYNH